MRPPLYCIARPDSTQSPKMAGKGIRQCLRDITPYLIVLIVISTLGPLQFGYHLAELNTPQDVLTCHRKTIMASRITKWIASAKPEAPGGTHDGWLPECIPMNKAAFGTISSIFTVGGLSGALAAGPFSSKRGRLPAMRLTALFYILGAVVETLAGTVWLMAIGRLLAGVGAGASTVIVPLYISEVSPPNERGLFGAMTQISINVGILLTQTLGYFLSHDGAWRWILGTGVVIAAAQAIGLFVVPESPAWMAANGKAPKAKRTLQRIRGKGFDIREEIEDWDVDEGNNETEGLLSNPDQPPRPGSSSSADKGPPVHLGFIQVVKDPQYRPAIIAVIGVMFSQQLCGINSIVMYSVSLLSDLLPTSSALLAILISLVNLCTTVACSPLPDRLGRKTCLMLSIIGQGISSLVLAFSIVFGVKILSAIAVLFFVAFFAVGLGPVPFILASELVGQEAVGATQSWSLAANYIATFLVAQFFPIINQALNNAIGGQGWVYFIFAALAGACGLFVWWKVPETKGRQIQSFECPPATNSLFELQDASLDTVDNVHLLSHLGAVDLLDSGPDDGLQASHPRATHDNAADLGRLQQFLSSDLQPALYLFRRDVVEVAGVEPRGVDARKPLVVLRYLLAEVFFHTSRQMVLPKRARRHDAPFVGDGWGRKQRHGRKDAGLEYTCDGKRVFGTEQRHKLVNAVASNQYSIIVPLGEFLVEFWIIHNGRCAGQNAVHVIDAGGGR
ncbi:putative metabolite transport protein [Paramyrothecium foliicola]|nr:putative metabolite transport protein [Paramyrothecium foliicola]